MKGSLAELLGKRIEYWLLTPALTSVGLMVAGLAYLLYVSFLTFDPLVLYRNELTLSNYLNALTNPTYLAVLIRTTILSMLTSLTCIVIAIPYAYLVVRTNSPLLQKALIVAALSPFFIGEIVKAYGWLIVLGRNGLLPSLTRMMFGTDIDIMYTPIAVYIGLLQSMVPLAILVLLPSMAAIPRETEMAAQNLGAGPFRSFITVIIPQLKPGIIAALIVTFTISATEYAVPDLLGGGLVNFVANTIYNTLFNALNYPLATALSMILTAIVSLIVYALLKVARVGNVFFRGG